MAERHKEPREAWGSRLGVILAVAGSAIGLGNFLRFPVQAARNGGGAFMVPYFISFLLLGLPLMWVEWTTGRFGGGFERGTAPGIFETLWQKNRFIKYFGVIGIFGPTVIFVYYTYIESWLLGYSVFALTGKYAACQDQASMTAFLHAYQGLTQNEHFSSISTAYFFFLITFAVNIGVIVVGLRAGIERVCKLGMLVLFVCAVVIMIRVMTLGTPDPAHPEWTVGNGFGFLWNPQWAELKKAKVWLAAAGQIFFTLSVGFGVILTYASYLRKQDDVALSGLTAATTNEIAEVILGGSIVIPAAYAFFGHQGTTEIAAGGAFNLGFVTMPLVLQQVAFGGFFAFAWFFLLFVAGVTSSISLALPAVAFLEDEFNLDRKTASIIFAVATFTLCQIVIFFLGYGALDEMDFWIGTVSVVVFAAIEVILFAWVFGIDRAWTELHSGSDIRIPRIYRYIIKYVTPVFLFLILGFWIVQDAWPTLLLQRTETQKVPFVITLRVLLVALFAALAFLVWLAWRKREGRGAES
ncbi:MAG: sodium:calcium symporter [Planctomycetes bacterium RBG_13_60_9]|nr:MAG: sodium:calcium symporter [Planctomycetes bacterium RBG_13_60_9]